jgi:hypothetical protein
VSITPEEMLGRAALIRLKLAGFEVVPVDATPPETVTRYTCPHCGYTAIGGELENVSAEWGKAWHRACVPVAFSYYDTQWKPMLETQEPRTALAALRAQEGRYE